MTVRHLVPTSMVWGIVDIAGLSPLSSRNLWVRRLSPPFSLRNEAWVPHFSRAYSLGYFSLRGFAVVFTGLVKCHTPVISLAILVLCLTLSFPFSSFFPSPCPSPTPSSLQVVLSTGEPYMGVI